MIANFLTMNLDNKMKKIFLNNRNKIYLPEDLLVSENFSEYSDKKTINSIDKVIKFSKSYKKNNFKLIYCPPNTLIRPISKRLSKTNIEVGAQNSHQSLDYGAFTGQVNARMLKSVGAKYVILGHSENRMDGENDKLINLKIKNSIKSGLKIIFCIGESLKQKRDKKTNQVLNIQLNKGLKSIKKKPY